MTRKLTYFILLCLCGAVAVSCGNKLPMPDEGVKNDNMVLFSSGSYATEGTKAAPVTYVPSSARFLALMYAQQGGRGEYNFKEPERAFMLVEGNVGNSLYRQSSYVTPTPGNNQEIDHYGNDLRGDIFYWKSRNYHAFYGYIPDFNHMTEIPADTTQSLHKIAKPKVDPDLHKDEWEYLQYYTIDLKNPTVTPWRCMADQPDPLIAAEEKQPLGSTVEANRVYLTFRHQLSQVFINLKGHESMGNGFSAAHIKRVELLGVAEEAYVYPFPAYKNGTLHTSDAWQNPLVYAAGSKAINLSTYTTEQLRQNKWGTSFDTFKVDDASVVPNGYLTTFQCITFGQLWAIRIHWAESTDPGALEHEVTYEVRDLDFRNMKSGKRYIYNLELRRGTLAVIRTVIDDWIPYETDGGVIYNTDGSIDRRS